MLLKFAKIGLKAKTTNIGINSLTEGDAQLLDRIAESYTSAAHDNKPIYVQQTDRIKITEFLYYGDFKHNITTQKRTLKCAL
ncbi:MAG: hypothetical protein ACI9IA_000727 [Enterobacterales bacterium]|jgi:hypothetical protein